MRAGRRVIEVLRARPALAGARRSPATSGSEPTRGPARTAGSVTFAETPRSIGARGATCKPERGSRPLRRSAAPSTAVPCTGTTAERAGSDARPATRSTKESSGAGCEFRCGGRTTRCRCKLSRCLPVLRSTPTIAGGHRRSKDTSQETRNRPFSRSALDNVARFVEHRPQANHRRELVNRSEFCARIADRSSLSSADAASAVTAVISTITEALARGETVTIAGFGRFATKDRAARVARNPRSGEAVPVAASRVPTFKAGKTLRDAVDE